LIDYFGSFEEAKKADEKILNKLFSKQTAKKIMKAIVCQNEKSDLLK
jgi:hypothetical protein